jgi:hypothetical protein
MLRNFLQPRLSELGYASLWFQQDGVTAHTATASMEVLREIFPGRLISLRGDILARLAHQIYPLVIYLSGDT